MFKSVPEIENIPQDDLKALLVEAINWKSMTADQQYHTELYKLMSDLIDTYGSHINLQHTVDVISIECARRVANQIIRKSNI